jgi:hypothetical protein
MNNAFSHWTSGFTRTAAGRNGKNQKANNYQQKKQFFHRLWFNGYYFAKLKQRF